MAKPLQRNWSALAGWLFADLALILAFVFLDSTAQGTAGRPTRVSTTTTTTTTTIPETTTTIDISTGADPEPIVFEIDATVNTDSETLRQRLEAEIIASGDPRANQPILMVIIGGGSKGEPNETTVGTTVAANLREKIRGWSRVISGKTYFQIMAETSLSFGKVLFKIFPLAE